MAEEDQRTAGLTEVVNVARGAVEQEFQISERLDAKARGQVTLAGQWFAVAQAVSAIAYAAKGVDGPLLYLVAGAGVAGGVLLVIMFVQSAKVWRVREEGALNPHGILRLKASAEAEDAEGIQVAIEHYASLLQDRRRTNKVRADALEDAEKLWFAAMTVPSVQLVLALLARLFG